MVLSLNKVESITVVVVVTVDCIIIGARVLTVRGRRVWGRSATPPFHGTTFAESRGNNATLLIFLCMYVCMYVCIFYPMRFEKIHSLCLFIRC